MSETTKQPETVERGGQAPFAGPLGSAIPPTPWTMLEWLINNLHLIAVNIDAGYCEDQQKPSAIFHSLEYTRGGRPWSMKGEQRERLIAAIHREMNHVHKWEPITRYPGGWQDVCVDCGAHRDVPDEDRSPNAGGEVRRNAVTSTGLLADESKGEVSHVLR